MGRPGSPKSEGILTLNPASRTRRPKSATSGVIPGISWITITAGPDPARYTDRVVPACVNVISVKPSRASGIVGPPVIGAHLGRADVVEAAVGRLRQSRHDEACRDQRRDAAERD